MLKTLDHKETNALKQFYQLGKDIRSRNDSFEMPWSESQNIAELIDTYNLISTLIICEFEGKQGRIQAFYFKDKPEQGFLGRYECDDDLEIAQQLISSAEAWFNSQGVQQIFGPMNGSTWDPYRFNLTADKPLFPSEPYQPLYYVDQWKSMGFEIELLYETNNVPRDKVRPMKRADLEQLAISLNLKLVNFPKNLIEDNHQLKDYHAFFHECFEKNAHFQAISINRYKALTAQLMKIVDFEHSLVFVDQEEKPVSILISYKDVYHELYKNGQIKNEGNAKRSLYMKTISTLPKWRNNRLSQTLVNYGCVIAPEHGYEEVVFGTMWVDNVSAAYSRNVYKSSAIRTYGLFTKKL